MMIELIIIFFQIIFIDLVLAADNVLIVGMVASKFGKNQRKKIRNWGIVVAVLTRVILTFIIAFIVVVYYLAIAPFFLQYPILSIIFGLFSDTFGKAQEILKSIIFQLFHYISGLY